MVDSIQKPAIRLIVTVLRDSKSRGAEAVARHKQALAYAEELLRQLAEPKGMN